MFGPYEHLYPIVVGDHRFNVPEYNSLLRALQYVELNTRCVRLPWKNFCWNNTKGCCVVRFRERPGAPEVAGRACTLRVHPGLVVTELPRGGRRCMP